MIVSDKALDEAAEYLKKYCAEQAELLQRYYSDIKRLEGSWCGGDGSFYSMLQKAQSISNGGNAALAAIGDRYTAYYRKKAEMIRNRPKFGGGYSSSGSSSSSSSGSSRSSAERSSGGGGSPFDKVFEHCKKEIVTKLYACLKKVHFYKPEEKICFYDPYGKSKRGLYKNVMAIDINSPTFKKDMLSLTGQHVFYQLQQQRRMALMRSVANDMQIESHNQTSDFVTLTQDIKNGTGIETKYISFTNGEEKAAFSFFAKAFQATLSEDNDTVGKYKRYYSDSYKQFEEIIKSLED